MWSWNVSPSATIFTRGSASMAFSAAPLPRPPQPITPTRIASLPAAWTAGKGPRWVATAPPTAPAVAAFKNSRREAGVVGALPFSVITRPPRERSGRGGRDLVGWVESSSPTNPSQVDGGPRRLDPPYFDSAGALALDHQRTDPAQVLLLVQGPHDSKADEGRVGV